MDYEKYQEFSEFLKTIAHPTRLTLLQMIRKGEPCVKDMHESLDLSQPNISRHLGLLRNAHVVESICQGNKRCYRLLDQRVNDILDVLT